MIGKPKDYEKINIGGERITPGGHRCIIMEAAEATSQKGSQMLVISFDTDATDAQPMYYQNRYINDKRLDKKWGGKMYIVTGGEYGPANVKRFCTAVEDSNEGFSCWDDHDQLKLAELKNKLVGVVFREEEFLLPDGQCRWSVKGTRFCNYHKALDQKVPEPKPLHSDAKDQAFDRAFDAANAANEGFMNIADDLEDEGLPFH